MTLLYTAISSLDTRVEMQGVFPSIYQAQKRILYFHYSY